MEKYIPNPAYTPINKTESQKELDDILYHVKRAYELAQTSDNLPNSLHGKKVVKKLVMDLTGTAAYIMDICKSFTSKD